MRLKVGDIITPKDVGFGPRFIGINLKITKIEGRFEVVCIKDHNNFNKGWCRSYGLDSLSSFDIVIPISINPNFKHYLKAEREIK